MTTLEREASQDSGSSEEEGPQTPVGPRRFWTRFTIDLGNDQMEALDRAGKETRSKDRVELLHHMAKCFLESRESSEAGRGAPYRITLHHFFGTALIWGEGQAGQAFVPEHVLEEVIPYCYAFFSNAK